MCIEKKSEKEKIDFFGRKANECKNDIQKIEFFDTSKEAFFDDSNKSKRSINNKISKELDDAFYVYANMKRLDEKEFEDLKSLTWKEYPDNLKIFLFDFCILNGDAYSKYFIGYSTKE
tara:strand:+ start:93 stop:446 length:354 start_codon:yes stop_codon:yes gene_type:complete